MPDEALEPTTLRVEIKNSRAVELDDLTVSLKSLGEEYRRWLVGHEEFALAGDVRLFIKEMRSGSIISDLIALAPYALPFIENANTLFSFCQSLKDSYEWLLGRRQEPPGVMDASTLQNLSNIVEPIAKDEAAQINIGTLNVTAPITINLNSLESNAVQNRAKREMDRLKETTATPHSRVLLYWYQARNDLRSKAWDRAVIESIHKGPVKAVCVNESIKTKMLLADSNPFTKAFIVDVSVETVKGKPALYRILDVFEAVDISELGDGAPSEPA